MDIVTFKILFDFVILFGFIEIVHSVSMRYKYVILLTNFFALVYVVTMYAEVAGFFNSQFLGFIFVIWYSLFVCLYSFEKWDKDEHRKKRKPKTKVIVKHKK